MTPYDTLRRESLSGRALEREVLARAAARLESPGDAPGALERAVEANRQLWMALAADLALPANACPPALKAGLISLAAYVERASGAALRGEGGTRALVEINRNVAAGLVDAPRAEAA